MFERTSHVANLSENDLSKPKHIFREALNNLLSYAEFARGKHHTLDFAVLLCTLTYFNVVHDTLVYFNVL